MTRFHQRTMALLGRLEAWPARSVDTLLAWAKKNGIVLPAAFLEWATLDEGTLLGLHSNDDGFWFDEPELVETPEGERGLLFHTENQGNFHRIVVLDAGDDPPVLSAWAGEPPWIQNTQRFSDAVFAQIFDWQYWIELDPHDARRKEMTYTGDLELQSSRCLELLRQWYEESVATHVIFDDKRYTEYRFFRSPQERLTVMVEDATGVTTIRISGRPESAVVALEAQLLEQFCEELRRQVFSSVGMAMDFLGSRIDRAWLAQILYACLRPPSDAVLDRLIACHRKRPLTQRASGAFPRMKSSHVLSGFGWGVRIRFQRMNGHSWQIESIEER